MPTVLTIWQNVSTADQTSENSQTVGTVTEATCLASACFVLSLKQVYYKGSRFLITTI